MLTQRKMENLVPWDRRDDSREGGLILMICALRDVCFSNRSPREVFKEENKVYFQKANSGNLMWTIMMCVCGFISYNKCTTQRGMVTVGRLCMWRARECMENPPCFQFCCELQTVLKNKVDFLEKVTVAIVGFSWVDFVGSLPLCVPEVWRATLFSIGIMTVNCHNPTNHTASRHGLLTRNQKWKKDLSRVSGVWTQKVDLMFFSGKRWQGVRRTRLCQEPTCGSHQRIRRGENKSKRSWEVVRFCKGPEAVNFFEFNESLFLPLRKLLKKQVWCGL